MKRALRLIFAWIFGAMFVVAGALKVRDPQLFTMQVRNFEMLPDPYNALLALSLPWLEIFCGLAVITGLLRLGGLLLLNAALLVFISVLGWFLARGKQVDCGCFGSALQLGMKQELFLDVALLVTGLWLLISCRKKQEATEKTELNS
jgi:putative oxidoreductase